MARQRFIWPDFWDDLDVAALSRDERLLFIGLFSLADDEGRIIADPRYLKAHVFRYDEDLSVDDVRVMRDRIAATMRSVVLYQVEGRDYIWLRQWKKWQKPKYPQPSKLPPPPEALLKASPHTPQAPDQVHVGTGETLRKGSPNHEQVTIPEAFPESSRSTGEALPHGMGWDGLGNSLALRHTPLRAEVAPPPGQWPQTETPGTDSPEKQDGIESAEAETDGDRLGDSREAKELNRQAREFWVYFCDVWRDVYPQGPRWTDARRKKIRARLQRFSLEELKRACDNLHASAFARGDNERGWVADLDYLIRSDEVVDRWLRKPEAQPPARAAPAPPKIRFFRPKDPEPDGEEVGAA